MTEWSSNKPSWRLLSRIILTELKQSHHLTKKLQLANKDILMLQDSIFNYLQSNVCPSNRPTLTLRITLLMLGLWMTPTSDQAENPLRNGKVVISWLYVFFVGCVFQSKTCFRKTSGPLFVFQDFQKALGWASSYSIEVIHCDSYGIFFLWRYFSGKESGEFNVQVEWLRFSYPTTFPWSNTSMEKRVAEER